jgi:hypothetical protein
VTEEELIGKYGVRLMQAKARLAELITAAASVSGEAKRARQELKNIGLNVN